MRLFISYARVDKRYCEQIIDLLDMHEVWYDKRLFAGQRWWDEIQLQIEQCEGFVYLLSPDSIASEYCRKEFQVARELGKHIFPVLIHPRASVPDFLREYQTADLSHELDATAVKTLLSAVFQAERTTQTVSVLGRGRSMNSTTVTAAQVVQEVPSHSQPDPAQLIEDAAEALDNADYDRALYLLRQAREHGVKSRFIDIERLIVETEAALEQQAYLRDAEREYLPIVALVKRERTRSIGREAFRSFAQVYPDYDPEGLAGILGLSTEPLAIQVGLLTEWCDVTGGIVLLEHGTEQWAQRVEPFKMSKFPITNAQFLAFVDDPDGYSAPHWWTFSPYAVAWHEANPLPLPTKFSEPLYPRGNVCWYEAMAFTRWLSHATGIDIRLPTEEQWQRAAQGDDGRHYPWGDKPNRRLCNTRESRLRRPSAVGDYPHGASPFGIQDMGGNIWEWTLNGYQVEDDNIGDDAIYRAVRGGSFMSALHHTQTKTHLILNPIYRYASIGIRVVCCSAI